MRSQVENDTKNRIGQLILVLNIVFLIALLALMISWAIKSGKSKQH